MIETWYAGHVVLRRGLVISALTDAAKHRSLVLCGPSSVRFIGEQSAGAVQPHVVRSIDLADVAALDATIEWSSDREIIAVGGGRVMDVAKSLAACHGINLTVAPTVLSNNSFATQKSVLETAGRRLSVMSAAPQHVLIDPCILNQVSLRCHLVGAADALSTYTALFDWQLAESAGRDVLDPVAATMSRMIRDLAFDQLPTLPSSEAEQVYESVTRMLVLSGIVTSFYGSGRPESGSEHRIARLMEQKVSGKTRPLHGEAVLVGMLLASTIQGQQNGLLYDFAAAVTLAGRLRQWNVTPDVLAGYLLEACTDGSDRYTVLDTITLGRSQARELAVDMLATLERSTADSLPAG